MEAILGTIGAVFYAGICLFMLAVFLSPYYFIFLAGRWLLRKAGILAPPDVQAAPETVPDTVRPPADLAPERRALLNYVRDALGRGDAESSVIFDLCEKGWTAVEAGEAVELHRRLSGTAG